MYEPQINKKIILIGRWEDDKDAKYPYFWMEKVIKEAQRLGFEVIDLNNSNFEKTKLTKMLEEKEPFMVILCGHGTPYSIKGHKNKTVIQLCNEDYLFKGKIVYAISCYTGMDLCKSARNKGCKSYIGWTDELSIPTQTSSNPEKDAYAQPCMDALAQIPISIMNGEDTFVAYSKCYEKLNEWIIRWRADMKYSLLASMLENIRDNLIIEE